MCTFLVWNEKHRKEEVRTEDQLRERIRMALIEDMNNVQAVLKEPENQFPQFIEKLTNHLSEIVIDELAYRKRY